MKDILAKLNVILDKKQKVNLFYLLIFVLFGSFVELLGVTTILPIMEFALDSNTIQENEIMKTLYNFSKCFF